MLNLRQTVWLTVGILFVGLLSAAAAAAALISTKFLIVILFAVLGGAVLILSGNTRLFLFYSLIFLSPFSIKKDFFYYPHMAGATAFDIHISDPFLLALLALQLSNLLFNKAASFRFPRPMYLWLALMALGLWSVISNPLPLPPAHEVYRMLRNLLWVIVIVNEITRKKLFLHAVYALLLTATVQAIFAYLQVLGIDFGLEHYGQLSKLDMKNLGASTLSGEFGVRRISGIMTHPNVLGAFLALCSGLALSLMFSTLSSRIKVIAATVWVSFVIVIILTLSRASWVDFAIVVIGVTLLTNANPYLRTRFLSHRTAILIGLILVGIVFSGQIIKRVTESVPQGLSSRWEFVDTSKKMILKKPWFGFGLNTYTFYQTAYNKYGSIDRMTKEYGSPGNWPVVHNSYLLIWVELGTVGFILWMWLHFSIIKVGIRNLKLKDPTLHSLNVALMVGYIAIMFDSLVSFFERLHEGILIWIFAALIFALSNWREKNESNIAIDQELPSNDSIENNKISNSFLPSPFISWFPNKTNSKPPIVINKTQNFNHRKSAWITSSNNQKNGNFLPKKNKKSLL